MSKKFNPTRSRSTRGFSTECTFVFGDTHFSAPIDGVAGGVCHDSEALSVLFQIMADRKPDRIIHDGDLLEFASVSRFAAKRGELGRVKGADGKLRDASLSKDIEMGECMWEYFAKAYPRAEKYQLEGNHDCRLFDLMSKPEYSQFGFAGIRNMNWAKYGVNFKSYDNEPWVLLGKLCVLHGYTSNSRKILKQHDNVIHGHCHRISYTPADDNRVEKRRSWGIGCMSSLLTDFGNRGGRQTGHSHGFAVVYRNGDDFQVRQVEVLPGYRVLDFDRKGYQAKPLKSIAKELAMLEN